MRSLRVLLPVLAAALVLAAAALGWAQTTLFEDNFQRQDSNSPGRGWSEYTLREGVVKAENSPWGIRGNTLCYEAEGRGSYIEDFIETVDTFPVDNVRVEFEFRGKAGTASGYVGPSAFWSGEAKNRGTAQNVNSGAQHIGVAASYRWENRGTKGVVVLLNAPQPKDCPEAVFAGLNQPDFAKHVMTIKDGSMTYEAPGFPAVTYPLANPLQSGERRHFTFGVRLYDPGIPQVIEIRNLKIIALGGDAPPDTARRDDDALRHYEKARAFLQSVFDGKFDEALAQASAAFRTSIGMQPLVDFRNSISSNGAGSIVSKKCLDVGLGAVDVMGTLKFANGKSLVLHVILKEGKVEDFVVRRQ
jgi:hypothetical protein